jgi:hypothetical protein
MFKNKLLKKIQHLRINLKEWFVMLGVVKQLSVVILVGLIIVILSSLVIGSVENAYLVFVDPSALPEVKDDSGKIIFSFLLMLFGLVVTGFIISVLSSSLENTFRDIRAGRLNYEGNNHTLIINYNGKIKKILDELNLLHKDNDDIHDVVILIDDEDNVEHLQSHIRDINNKFTNLHLYIRYGDVLSWQRYEELSILQAYSIILLGDEHIEDSFRRDNHSIRIVNLLFSVKSFKNYLDEKKKNSVPVKSIVELSSIDYSQNIIRDISGGLFLAISPSKILQSILNLSIINIDFYNIWTELLSFEGYEFYFLSAQKHDLHGSTYKDALLRHKNGILMGISRVVDGNFTLLLNEHDKIIEENDWLIFIAQNKHNISFEEKALNNTPKFKISQPKEMYIKNITIIGNKQDVKATEFLEEGEGKSIIHRIDIDEEKLYTIEYWDEILKDKDTVILNLEDEKIYRIALSLKEFYNGYIPEELVFLLDDTQIAKHLELANIKNTILSDQLFSKYMAQVSNQISLYYVFNILFQKDGPEINFILTSRIPSELLEDLQQLKVELISQGMVYMGCEYNDSRTVFEATNLSDACKIIVFSNGDF